MFEGSLIALLAADTDLEALLTTFESEPAIFSSVAPQSAETPYIVLDIVEYSTESMAVRVFDLTLDIYDRGASGSDLRDIARRIKLVLESAEIKTDANFDTIRFFYRNGQEVPNPDTDIRHYVCMVDARGGDIAVCEEVAA